MRFTVVIPVYNRPEEVDELLGSLMQSEGCDFEVIIVEDGSQRPCREVVEKYAAGLDLKYFQKENSGPGPTRNYGAQRASGDYLVFFDSDCLVPDGYFAEVEKSLALFPADGWGGPDTASESFSPVQKAINYAMTSFLTTGGIRGKKKRMDKFYARSFNMGIKRSIFESVGGFSGMRVGEDIDLSFRLFAYGYTIRLFPGAWVYHKRRTDFRQFLHQVRSFGKARVTIARLHPGTLKAVHVLPALFAAGVVAALLVSLWLPWVLLIPALYFFSVFVDSSIRNHNVFIGMLSVPAAFIELWGYGTGFIAGLFAKNDNTP